MKTLRRLIAATALAAALPVVAQVVDLSGDWRVRLAGDNTSHPISLPSTTDMAGIGVPDTLSPALTKPQLLHLTRRHSYVGPAVYSTEVTITPEMAHKPLELEMERVLWRSRARIGGIPFDTMGESLTTPHRLRLSSGLSAGTYPLDIEIDNSKHFEISGGNLAHAYTNDTQIMWNGILGRFSLSALPEIHISDIQIYPDAEAATARVVAEVENLGRSAKTDRITCEITAPDSRKVRLGRKVKLLPGVNRVEFDFSLADGVQLWSEYTPSLYSAEARSAKTGSSRSSQFGMRDIKSDGRRLTVNGNPVFLRGTLECCVFPLTGNPPLDEAGWEKVIGSAQEWGLNHLRFHSWCPPEAAFRVADRKGMYLQVELPLWSTSIAEGHAPEKDFIAREYYRIAREYGNHPSFCLMTVGNELQSDFSWLNSMVEAMKRNDPRHLYAASSFTFERGHGGHAEPHDDFLVTQWTDNGWVRGQGVFNAEPPAFDKDYSASMGCVDVPLVSHEIGQYAVYPDLREIDRYTGTLDPLNFKAIRDDLARKGRLHRAKDYLDASGHLAAILYKEEMERAMKTPGFSGIQLLGLQDFPGQGTALVGLVNAFWESKGVADPGWFRRFSSPVVPLARFGKAVYTAGERFEADIDIANYLRRFGSSLPVEWTLTDGRGFTRKGSLSVDSLPYGNTRAGSLAVDLKDVPVPSRLTFEVAVADTVGRNSWSVWVYPDSPSLDLGDIVATRSEAEAREAFASGRKVIYSPVPDSLRGFESKFVPVFWSPVHFPSQAGGMGLLCDPSHPALAQFPNDGHSDWQWWTIAKNARVVDNDTLPGMTPVIEVVDNFTSNRPLGLLFEQKNGDGHLIYSAIDLLGDLDGDPARRQLLASILAYLRSDNR